MLVLMADGDKERAELSDMKGLGRPKRARCVGGFVVDVFHGRCAAGHRLYAAKLAVLQAVLEEGFVWIAVFAVVFIRSRRFLLFARHQTDVF